MSGGSYIGQAAHPIATHKTSIVTNALYTGEYSFHKDNHPCKILTVQQYFPNSSRPIMHTRAGSRIFVKGGFCPGSQLHHSRLGLAPALALQLTTHINCKAIP